MSRFISRVALANICRAGVPQLARRAVFSVPSRAFSSALIHRQKETAQLSQIVKSELKISLAVDNELDEDQEKYLSDSGFQIQESKFHSNVELFKTLPSGEEVRVFFDVDEVSDIEIAAPEFSVEEGAEDKEQFDEELDQYESTFAFVKVLISKPGSNDGLFFNLMLQNSEEELLVDYFNYKPDAAKFLARIKEQGKFLSETEYQGPQFSHLDESLQLAMENYLEQKGINEQLAEFIFAYSEYKEEASYRDLLGNVSKFLEK